MWITWELFEDIYGWKPFTYYSECIPLNLFDFDKKLVWVWRTNQ